MLKFPFPRHPHFVLLTPAYVSLCAGINTSRLLIAAAPWKAVWENHNVAFVEAVSQRCWFNSVVFHNCIFWEGSEMIFFLFSFFILNIFIYGIFLLLFHTQHIFINQLLGVCAALLVWVRILKLHDVSPATFKSFQCQVSKKDKCQK